MGSLGFSIKTRVLAKSPKGTRNLVKSTKVQLIEAISKKRDFTRKILMGSIGFSAKSGKSQKSGTLQEANSIDEPF